MRKLEFAKYAIAALAVAGLTASAAPAAKAANFNTAQASVIIAQTIAVAFVANMNFGKVVIPVDTDAVYALDQNNTVTESGTTTGQVIDDAGQNGEFTVTGAQFSSIALTLSSGAGFSDNDVTFKELELFGTAVTSNTPGTTGATGVISDASGNADTVEVAGKINVNKAAGPDSTPTATLTLTANYQ